MRFSRLLLVTVAVAGVAPVFALGGTPAQASCYEPDQPCDPPPHPMPRPAYVEFGCGTVTVHAIKYDKTVDTQICPGPAL